MCNDDILLYMNNFRWDVSSCTVGIEVLQSDNFFDKAGLRTLFSIECQNGKSEIAHIRTSKRVKRKWFWYQDLTSKLLVNWIPQMICILYTLKKYNRRSHLLSHHLKKYHCQHPKSNLPMSCKPTKNLRLIAVIFITAGLTVGFYHVKCREQRK